MTVTAGTRGAERFQLQTGPCFRERGAALEPPTPAPRPFPMKQGQSAIVMKIGQLGAVLELGRGRPLGRGASERRSVRARGVTVRSSEKIRQGKFVRRNNDVLYDEVEGATPSELKTAHGW